MSARANHLGTAQPGTLSLAAARERLPDSLATGSGGPGDESIFIYRVLEVAHGLRYHSLDALIGTEFVARTADSAEQDFARTMGGYLDGSRFQGQLFPVGAGTHRAYGFLDLTLPAKSELAVAGALQGIPLLESLGFLSREESGPFMCPQDFELLVNDIRQGQACLCVLAQDEAWHRSARGWWRAGGGTAPAEYQPVFPLRFKIVDAGIANSAHVWRWKHFYW